MSQASLTELLDPERLQRPLALLHEATEMPVAVRDAAGALLQRAGASDSCWPPLDTAVWTALGLRHVARPIRIAGRAVATLLVGPYVCADSPLQPQVLRDHAAAAGLAAAEVTAAARALPVCAADRAAQITSYVADVAELLSSRATAADHPTGEPSAWAMLDATHDLAALVDAHGRILAANEAFAHHLGQTTTALRGVDLLSHLPAEAVSDWRDKLKEVVQAAQPQRFTESRQRRELDHCLYPLLDADGQVTRLAVFTRDLTPRLRAEKAHRLAALGQLAGSVAHEFNNLLCDLWMNADLALSKGSPTEYEAFCRLVSEQARRGGGICRDLMSFARPTPPRRQPVCPHEPIEAALDVARPELVNSGIAVQRHYRCPDALISADPSQLQQVYLNLALNACHAMPTGGVLTVRTELQRTPAGDEVVAQVCDQGCGIAPEHLPRVFEPFFSAWNDDREAEVPRVGLGLAVSHGLVTAQGGNITAHSEWGAGATLELRFPALLRHRADAEANEDPPMGQSGLQGRGLRVLVAEDEDNLREALREALTGEGLHVLPTASGDEALAALTTDRFEIVITDLLMPGGSGMEVLAAASALPQVPRILVITGKIGGGLQQELHAAGAQAVLHKPFGVADIIRAVRELLK